MRGRRALWTAKLSGKNTKPSVFSIGRTDFQGAILGIDPSLRGSGFGVIRVDERQQIHWVDSLTLKLSAKKSFVDCLGEIFLTTQRFLERYAVCAVALEQTIYVQNLKTAQVLGAVRGACLSAVALQHLQVVEFPPLRIKKSVTGIGNATKLQVSAMIAQLLHLPHPLPPDESDAVGAALCFFSSLKSLKV